MMYPHHFGGPDPDPHQNVKSGAVKNYNCTVKVQLHHFVDDPDPYKKSHSDPHLL